MQNENTFIQIITKKYREYSSKFKSYLYQKIFIEIHLIFKTYIKCTYPKLLLICLLISTIYLLLNPNTITNMNIIQIQQKLNHIRSNAFIITADCNSLRYNTTKENIERVFPNFFNILCYLFVPLNDSRIHDGPLPILKKFSSNLLTFLDLWTYKIPDLSKDNEFQWTFIFEDDVNFHNPLNISLTNYIDSLQELMYNPIIQRKHGFLYLGICEPSFDNNSKSLISKTSKDLLSEKSCGFCLHATGITTNRSRLFWGEITSYRSNMEESLGKQMQDYCVRSKNYFYTFGSNFYYSSNMKYYGIAYQDHNRFSPIIT